MNRHLPAFLVSLQTAWAGTPIPKTLVSAFQQELHCVLRLAATDILTDEQDRLYAR